MCVKYKVGYGRGCCGDFDLINCAKLVNKNCGLIQQVLKANTIDKISCPPCPRVDEESTDEQSADEQPADTSNAPSPSGPIQVPRPAASSRSTVSWSSKSRFRVMM